MSDPREEASQAERAVEESRARLTGIVRELDRRRHAALDVRGQLRRHPAVFGLSAGVLLLLIGGGIGLGVWRHRRQARPLARAHRLRLALARAVERPDEVARTRPSVPKKALGAFTSAAAAVLARKLAEGLIARGRVAKG